MYYFYIVHWNKSIVALVTDCHTKEGHKVQGMFLSFEGDCTKKQGPTGVHYVCTGTTRGAMPPSFLFL
jgi:hypothetical protein